MIPTITLDERSPWASVRRMEVFRYAHELGITEFQDGPNGIPAKNTMVRALVARGVPPPKVPPRSIGKDMNPRASDTTPDSHRFNGEQKPRQAETVTIDADELLDAQWRASQKKEVGFNEMRAELKAAGVKLDRRWRMAEVKEQWEKLRNGKNAA